MPELILEIAALDYVFPAPHRRCVIGPDGGTIGRDARNHFVLDDPYGRVSRLHAEVTFVRGVPILSNRSATLVVNVGDHEVGPGDSAIVQDDDVIEIGPYLLAARLHDERGAVAAPVATVPPRQRPVVTTGCLGAAFIEGARLPADVLPADGLNVETAELLGAMLRHAVQGTMDLLAARSITQREVRLGAALLADQSNNPLAFLPNADAAMAQLLTGQLPGFMHATRAMPDAFADLIAHDAGVMAGMRAALSELLSRLDPRQVDDSLHDAQVASARIAASVVKARWWDAQSARVSQLQSVAEDDFQQAWGHAFADAYAGAASGARVTALANLRADSEAQLKKAVVAHGGSAAAPAAGFWQGESCAAL